ncbi:hypothetical protein [Mesorhizobium sp. INR15]|nr:hypothetical protein [Mesorhizobium sp. INR15]
MKSARYYKPTVGSDYIPDRFAWIDRVAPWAFFGVGVAMWVAVIVRHFS